MARTKKRIKTTKEQYKIYLKYLQENTIFLNGKLKPSDDKSKTTLIWNDIVKELNSAKGSNHDVEGWKKVFREWKSNIRKKARGKKELTSSEQKLLDLTKTESNVIELGTLTVKPEANILLDEEKDTSKETDNTVQFSRENESEAKTYETININLNDLDDEKAEEPQPKKSRKNSCEESSNELSRGLERIAESIDGIALAINRYCDIIEKK